MTYSEAVLWIISQCKRADASITSDVQIEFLNAIEHYSTKRFWFNEGTWGITTSSSLAYYALPTDLMEIDVVNINISGSKTELEPDSYANIDAIDPGNCFGDPYCYGVFAEQFRLFPVPNRAYTFMISGQKRLATLSATSDTNAWTNQALELIAGRTIKTLARIRWKDQERMAMGDQMEQEALLRLETQTEKYATGRVAPGY